jgi:AmiR/NasT family two-component response regulator
VTRLTKRAVERLLADYDTDPVGALTTALRAVLVCDASWPDLVVLATDDADRRTRLLALDVDALDGLARELNELRGLGR